MLGTNISQVDEVLGLSKQGFWLLLDEEEAVLQNLKHIYSI